MKPTTTWVVVLNGNIIPSTYHPSYGFGVKGCFDPYGVNHMTVYIDTSAMIEISAAQAATSASGSFSIIYPMQ